MSGLGQVLIWAGIAVFVTGVIRYGMQITFADVAADALMAAGFALIPNWIMAGASAAVGAFMASRWWRRRKRRGRLAAIGAKTRARIAAMASRMRERPARPVLRPVPGAAR